MNNLIPLPPSYQWENSPNRYRLVHHEEGVVGAVEKSDMISWYQYDMRINGGKTPVGGPFPNDYGSIVLAMNDLVRRMNIRNEGYSRKASYNPNAGKKPLDFSKPWTLTKDNLKARLTHLQINQKRGNLSRGEVEEMNKIKGMMKNNRLASLQHRVARLEKVAAFSYNPLAGTTPIDFSNKKNLNTHTLNARYLFLLEKGEGRLTLEERVEFDRIRHAFNRRDVYLRRNPSINNFHLEKTAHLEKEAAFKALKQKIRAMLGSFGKSVERGLLYMPERDIKKAVRELKRNPEFMEAIKKVPPRSSFQRVKEFLSHYLRKELRLSNTVLVIAVVVGTIAYFMPAVGVPLLLLGLVNAVLDDPGIERETTQNRAQYHARNRILNEREAGGLPLVSKVPKNVWRATSETLDSLRYLT